MPSVSAATDRFVSYDERQEIQEFVSRGVPVARIARVLGRHRSTIYAELKRGRRGWTDPDGTWHPRPYLASAAQARRDEQAHRPKDTKLVTNPALAAVVQEMFDAPSRPSPQQVVGRLARDFPDDESMRISHETLYKELYVQARGTLKVQVKKVLRSGRVTRKPRMGTRAPKVPGELLIANRPAEVDDRIVPGHWEGDLILGAGNASAVGTLVERTTRFVILLHLPEGHGAAAVADAMATAIGDLPEIVRKSLTWDQGSEMVGGHERVAAENDIDVWFAEPGAPWMRGSNENTNGLLRQYLPKGSDLSVHTAEDLAEIQTAINNRPRKTLEFATPAEVMHELLSLPPNPSVASTP